MQRRLCPIFVRDVGSPDIHECFCGLTGSQRTLGTLGVTAWYHIYDYLGSSGLGSHHHLGGLMFGSGMRLPRKSRDKTRTLHASVLGDC